MGRPVTGGPMTGPIGQGLRFALAGILLLGWLVAVWQMWEAMAIPSGARHDAPQVVAMPTVRTFVAATIFSGLELGIILALLWPWRPEYYATRLAAAVIALAAWFVTTTPLDVTRMDQVHRRWMLGMAATMAGALGALLLYRAARRFSQPSA